MLIDDFKPVPLGPWRVSHPEFEKGYPLVGWGTDSTGKIVPCFYSNREGVLGVPGGFIYEEPQCNT